MTITTRSGKGSELSHAELDANWLESGAVGADIASAATTTIGAATGNHVTVTGTTTITSLGTTGQKGMMRWVTFSGALTLTYHATNLILPWGGDITTEAGDMALFVKNHATNAEWKCVLYVPNLAQIRKLRRARWDWLDDGSSGTSKTIDFSGYQKHKLQATGACALTFTAPSADEEIALLVQGDGTQRAFTWPSTVDWEGGTAPTMPTASDDYLEVRGRYNGSRYHLTWGRFGY